MATKYEVWDHRTYRRGYLLSSAYEGPTHYRLSQGGDRSDSDVYPFAHNYSATFVDGYEACYRYSYRNHPEIFGYSGPTFPTIQRDAWTDVDDFKLLNKLAERYDNTPFDAGIAGAELGKSVDMLANRVRQAALAAKLARRGNFREAAGVLASEPSHIRKNRREAAAKQNLFDLNLEIQYGWRTWANDIYDLAVAIDAQARRKIIRAKRTINGMIIPDPMFPCTGSTYIRKSIVAYLEVDDPMWPERMGLVNPLGILWEVTPWSLVVDWALPIGDWIAAQSFAFRARGTFVTSVKEYTKYRGVGHRMTDTPVTVYEPLGRWMQSSCSFKRTVTNSLAVPMPSFKSPLKSGEPLQRLANALSFLMGSARNGRRY